MTHPHSIDDTFRVDGDDPRELLAAFSGAFHDVPERAVVIAGIDYSGSFISIARLRMDEGPIFHTLECAVRLAAHAAFSGAATVVCAVMGDISPAVTGFTLPPSAEELDEQYPRRLAGWLAREIAFCELPVPAVAYYFDGEGAGVSLVEAGGVSEWDTSHLGSLHDSVHAAHLVAQGHSFALDAGPRHFVSEEALEELAERWQVGARAPVRALGALAHEPYEAHMSGATQSVEALIQAGATASGWLREGPGAALVKKYELLEHLVLRAETKPGRDAAHFAVIRLLYPECEDLDRALELLFESAHYAPNSDIAPGGSVYFLSRLPAVVLAGLRGRALEPRIEKGLVNLACNHALLTWWAGRLGEASETVREVLMRDPEHEMGQYVSCIIDAGIMPAWLSARIRAGAYMDGSDVLETDGTDDIGGVGSTEGGRWAA